jgi:hypothetical protein
MKSNCVQNPLFGHRVGMGITVMLAVAAVLGTFTGGVADEPATKPSGFAMAIDTPFDAAKMPTAESLVGDNPLRSSRWAAKICLATDSPDTNSLGGTLYNTEHIWFGNFQLEGDVDRELRLLVNKERAVAWTNQSEDEDEALLRRLVKGIYLLETLTPFPDQRHAEAKSVDDVRISNLGVQTLDGDGAYVVEVKVNEGDSQPARLVSLESERILIKFAVDNSMPRQVSAIAANGSRWELTFESIKTEVGDDLPAQIGEPLEDSLVIDLSGTEKSGGGLKNPVPYSAESIKRGKLLYIADCEVCHSVDGTGRDSDVTDNAADLTNTEFWLSDGSETATFLAIRDGAGDEMPGYKDEYRDEKMIWDLVNYILSLQK